MVNDSLLLNNFFIIRNKIYYKVDNTAVLFFVLFVFNYFFLVIHITYNKKHFYTKKRKKCRIRLENTYKVIKINTKFNNFTKFKP